MTIRAFWRVAKTNSTAANDRRQPQRNRRFVERDALLVVDANQTRRFVMDAAVVDRYFVEDGQRAREVREASLVDLDDPLRGRAMPAIQASKAPRDARFSARRRSRRRSS